MYQVTHLKDHKALQRFMNEANKYGYIIICMTESNIGFTIIYKYSS